MPTSHIGLRKESSWGVLASTTNTYLPFISESIQAIITPVEIQAGLNRPYKLNTNPGLIKYSGTIDIEVDPNSIQFILDSLIGSAITTRPDIVNAPNVFRHVFNPRVNSFHPNCVLNSYSIEIFRETGQSFVYLGAVVDWAEFSFSRETGIVQCSCGIIARDEIVQTPTTSSFVPGRPFLWTDVRVDLGGAWNVTVEKVGVKYQNNSYVTDTVDGTNRISRIIRDPNNRVNCEVSLVLEFQSRAEYNDFITGTTRALSISLISDIIQSNIRFELEFFLPRFKITSNAINKTGHGRVLCNIIGEGTLHAADQPVRVTLHNGAQEIIITPSSISVAPSDLSINVGATHTFFATVFPSGSNQNVTWTSSNTAIGTINAAGLFTAIAVGNVNITATSVANTTISRTVPVVVTQNPTGITITPPNATISVSRTVQFNGTVVPATANQSITWDSSSPQFASISATGLVTGVAEGTTNITGRTVNLISSANSLVTVIPLPANISISPTEVIVNVGATIQLTATIIPSNSVQTVTWTSSHPSIATVNATGLVTGVSQGQTSIICTSTELTTLSVSRSVRVITPTTPRGVAVGENISGITFDGINYTLQHQTGIFQSIVWATEINRFCAVGNNVCITSPSGLSNSWTVQTIPAGDWISVAWSPTLNMLCAVGRNGTSAISTNMGVTWTSNPTNTNVYNKIIWVTGLNLFIRIGTNICETSTNGTAWTVRTIPNGQWFDLAHNTQTNSIFAITWDRFLRTTDAITWIEHSLVTGMWTDIAFSPALNMLCVVGENACITSVDNGNTWLSRTIPVGRYLDVSWSSDFVMWIAVGNNLLSTSTNGVTWISRTAMPNLINAITTPVFITPPTSIMVSPNGILVENTTSVNFTVTVTPSWAHPEVSWTVVNVRGAGVITTGGRFTASATGAVEIRATSVVASTVVGVAHATVVPFNDVVDGLQLRLAFDEGTGTTLQDTSGNNNTGIINSGTWGITGTNRFVEFNGTAGSFVNLGNHVSLRPRVAFTLALTVEFPVLPITGRISSFGAGTERGWQLLIIGNELVGIAGDNTNDFFLNLRFLHGFAVNTRVHLIFSFNGERGILFVNAVNRREFFKAMTGIFRQPITINNTTNPNILTNHQVQIVVNTQSQVALGRMRADGNDIRFFDGATSIPYFIDSGMNTTATTIFVRVPSIPANGTITIEMRFGDPNATPGSNAAATFDWFEGFDGTAIDTTRWNIVNATGWSVANGELRGTNTTGRLLSLSTFSAPIIQEVRVRTVTLATNGHTIGGFWVSTTNGFTFFEQNTDFILNESTWVNIGGVTSLNVPFLLRFTALGTTLNLTVINLNTGAIAYNVTHTNTVLNEPIMLGQTADNLNPGQAYDCFWDFIRIRKFANPEPTITIGDVILPNVIDYTNASNAVTAALHDNLGVRDNLRCRIYNQRFYNRALTVLENRRIGQIMAPDLVQPGLPLTGWSRRKSKIVIGTVDGAQPHFQMLTIRVHRAAGTDTQSGSNNTIQHIHAGTNVRTDFGDVRFTAADGTTLLPYWIQLSTTTFADFTVRVSSIPANPGQTTIFVYYDNPTATSVSNEINTFDFAGNFVGTAIDTTRWNIVNASGLSVSGGELRGTIQVGRVTSVPIFSAPSILEIRARIVTDAPNGFTLGSFWASTTDTFALIPYPPGADWIWNNTAWANIGDTIPAANTPLLLTFIAIGTTVTLTCVRLDTGVQTYTGSFTNTVLNERIMLGKRADDGIPVGEAYDAFWRFVHIRRHTTNHPSWGATGPEEM